MPPLKVAMILADERECNGEHQLDEPYFGPAPTTLLAGLRQTKDVEVHIVSPVRKRVSNPSQIGENLFYHAVQVPEWGYLKTVYLPTILGVRKKLRQINPHVVHGQGTERYQGLCSIYSGFPNLLTIHGNMREIAKILGAKTFSFYGATAQLEAWTLPRTGGVLCLTRYTRDLVQPLNNKTWLLPNAVDEEFFKIQAKPRAVPTIICVGTIDSRKNQNALIRALDPIAAEKKFRLIFLGGANPSHPYSLEFFELVGARNWCEFAGIQRGPELREFFAQANMLILASLEDNCPMVVIEAMAAGLPVAASAVGGVPDLINSGTDGILFDPRDPAEIRAAVSKLLFNSDEAKRLAAAGRKRALEKHHPKEIARGHVKIYQDLLATD